MNRLSKEEGVKKAVDVCSKAYSIIPQENFITCEELWELLYESDEYIILVDARDDVERNVSKIQGSISYAEYLDRLEKENFPFIRTICYSTVGRRSCEIVKELLSKGVRAYSLLGGLVEWCNFGKGEIVNNEDMPTHMIHVYNPDYRPLFNKSYICVY